MPPATSGSGGVQPGARRDRAPTSAELLGAGSLEPPRSGSSTRPAMASTFTRLYRYAKTSGVAEAKENFTTEALRAAIESDEDGRGLSLRSL